MSVNRQVDIRIFFFFLVFKFLVGQELFIFFCFPSIMRVLEIYWEKKSCLFSLFSLFIYYIFCNLFLLNNTSEHSTFPYFLYGCSDSRGTRAMVKITTMTEATRVRLDKLFKEKIYNFKIVIKVNSFRTNFIKRKTYQLLQKELKIDYFVILSLQNPVQIVYKNLRSDFLFQKSTFLTK